MPYRNTPGDAGTDPMTGGSGHLGERLAEARERIKVLEAENADLRDKLEAVTAANDYEIVDELTGKVDVLNEAADASKPFEPGRPESPPAPDTPVPTTDADAESGE